MENLDRRSNFLFLNDKKEHIELKLIRLTLKRVSGWALHKYAPGIYIIYVWTYCVSRTKTADMVEW